MQDVEKLRGSIKIEHTLARMGAERLRKLLDTEPYVHALGALTGDMAVQQVLAGLKAIYLSGWQVAADANSALQTCPDQSLYPVDSMPKVIERINKAFQCTADQIQHAAGKDDVYWFAPIVADAEAGSGGDLDAYELMRAMIKAGAAGVHFEDQLASAKKCGHMGGKVLVPTGEFVQKLQAARLAADECDTPTVIIAHTDAKDAFLLTSDTDERDRAFCTGERTSEGLYRINGGIDSAIARGLAYAPYADLLSYETSSPDLEEATKFARAMHEKFPGKMLAYNCSPSFNWKANLGELGFKLVNLATPMADASNTAASPPAEQRSAKRQRVEAPMRTGVPSRFTVARQVLREPFPPGQEQQQPLGREAQHQQLTELLDEFLANGQGRAVHACGPPGTGKSLTVAKALEAALARASCSLQRVSINCMTASSCADVRAVVAAALAEPAATCSTAARQASAVSSDELIGLLRSHSSSGSRRHNSSCKVVLVLDEADALLAKGTDELRDLYLLPQQPGVQVMVISIANTLNMETMLCGTSLVQIDFGRYTQAQVLGILLACQERMPDELFEHRALEMCAVSIARESGDMRQALRACKLALDQVERQQQQQDVQGALVKPATMAGALNKIADPHATRSGIVTTSSISSLPQHQQLLLYALAILRAPDAIDTANSLTAQLWQPARATPPAKAGSRRGAGSAAGAEPAGVVFDDLLRQYKKVCEVLKFSNVGESAAKDLCQQMALVGLVALEGFEQGLSSRGKFGKAKPMAVVLRPDPKSLLAALANNALLAPLF